jgi:hypothetical protein
MDTHPSAAELSVKEPLEALPYATPAPRRARRWRTLPASLAIVVVICGTVLAGMPCIAALSYGSGIPDYLMALCWATAGAGLFVILLGIFLAAPRNGKGRAATTAGGRGAVGRSSLP